MIEIIIAYLLGIVVEYNFRLDLYSHLFLLCVFLLIIYFSNSYKRHEKYTGKWLSKILFYLLLFAIFAVSSLYTKYTIDNVSYKYIDPGYYQTTGKIVSVKHSNINTSLTLEVEKMFDLEKSKDVMEMPNYINVNVSLYNNYKLYDRMEIAGILDAYTGNSFYDKKPFLFNYEFMKLSENVFYNVSYPKNISVLENNNTFYETLYQNFLLVSDDLKKNVSLHMAEPFASIASALSTGDQQNLQKDIKDIFKNSGLIHVLVLSGANVALIISFFWLALQKLQIRRASVKVSLAVISSWIFIFATGLTPPSVRAGIMASGNILSEYFRKNFSTIYSLLLALFILTIINPLLLVQSPSLHLSFLACFGLFILAPEIEKYLVEKFSRTNKLLLFFLSVSISLFLVMTPYILSMSGQSPIFGTLLTIFIEPLVVTSIVLTYSIIFSSIINSFLADLFGILNSLVVEIILVVAKFGSENLPQISYQLPKSFLIIYYLLLVAILNFQTKKYSNKKVENGIIRDN